MGTYSSALTFQRYDSGHLTFNSGVVTDSVLYTIPTGVLHGIVVCQYFGGQNTDGGGGPNLALNVTRTNAGFAGTQNSPVVDTKSITSVTPETNYPANGLNFNLLDFGAKGPYSIGGVNTYSQLAFPGDTVTYTKGGAAGPSDIIWFRFNVYLVY